MGSLLGSVLPEGVPLVEHVEVVVAVDDHGLPSGRHDADDLRVRLLRLGEVPQHVAGDHEIEGPVLELHVLGVHPEEADVYPLLRSVGLGLLHHLVRVVDPGDIHPVGAEDERHEAGAAAHVQDPGPLRGPGHVQDGGVHVVAPVRHLVHDGGGESGAPQVPVVPDILCDLHVITFRRGPEAPVSITCRGTY